MYVANCSQYGPWLTMAITKKLKYGQLISVFWKNKGKMRMATIKCKKYGQKGKYNMMKIKHSD